MPTLFDDIDRSDVRPRFHQESEFDFYNRIATLGWSRVRDEIEGWFALYCNDAEPAKANDLRARFRSADPRQHLAAWWELYTYRLLRALHPAGRIDCEAEEPAVATRPDFRVSNATTDSVELYVESVTTFSGIIEENGRNPALVAYVLDTINEIQSHDFWIHLDIPVFGTEQPSKREIKRPIEAWLATLDYQVEFERRLTRDRRQPERIRFRDWEISVEPLPKGTPGSHERLIGIGPGGGGVIDDSAFLKAAVLSKARRYGALPAPYVIALAPTAPILRSDDVVTALVGRTSRDFDPEHPEGGELVRLRDGAWSTGADGVSGVLTGPEILPWTVAKTSPTLWVNPAAPQPVGDRLDLLPRVEFTDAGEPVSLTPSASIAELLGLEPEWPGELWAR